MATASSSVDGILERVLADPRRALDELDTWFARDSASSELDRVRRRWARGTALRDLGRLDEAERDLRAAVAGALDADERRLAGRIAVTLSLVVLYRGDADAALTLLDDAAPDVDPAERGHVSMQRGLIHHRMGRLDDAQAGYERALRQFESAGDELGIARACVNLGVLCAHRGSVDEGIAVLERAHRSDHAHVAAVAAQNLGFLHARAGDVPAALGALAEAEARFAQLGNDHQVALTRADRATVLMQVNVLAEAQAEADAALAVLRSGGHVADTADVALLAARVRLANGDPAGARRAAEEAAAAFAAQHRDALLVLSRFVELQADLADDPGAPGAADRRALRSRATRASELATSLARAGWTNEAVMANLSAGRCLLDAGELTRARAVLAHPRLRTRRRPADERVAVHLARALVEVARDDRVAARRSVSAGLTTFAANQASFGALELRAHATALADDLANLGARLAIADRRPRELLSRIEAARGAVARLPRARPPDDDDLSALVTRLRTVVADLREAVATGRTGTSTAAVQERELLERRIADRARVRRSGDGAVPISLQQAVHELAPAALVEYEEVDGRLVAVSVVDGRAAMHDLGSVRALQHEIDALSFALHRCHRQQGTPASRRAAIEALVASGSELADALLPERVSRTHGPLVVVPTGALHGLAWGAMPPLAGRPVSIAPSLLAHAVAGRAAGDDRDRAVALVAGPGLDGAAVEIARLAPIHPRATVLGERDATVDRVADVVSAATLVHLACHGTFRTDNPLFSALHLADGDVTIYDLERCARLPSAMVLSACNAAQSAVLRGGALLGLSSALLQLGVSSVVAPVTPVSDERSADVMVRLHGLLAAGVAPAQALATASLVDGEVDPTAASFVCIGR